MKAGPMAFMRGLTFPGGQQPVIRGERVYLRYPRMPDYLQWSKLRGESRAFLSPWEPQWARDELTKGAFREGTFGRRSGTRCPRADECDPLPGGSGSPVDRQKDRSARSVLNSRRHAANGQNTLCAVP